jgi:hypothetical protein
LACLKAEGRQPRTLGDNNSYHILSFTSCQEWARQCDM